MPADSPAPEPTKRKRGRPRKKPNSQPDSVIRLVVSNVAKKATNKARGGGHNRKGRGHKPLHLRGNGVDRKGGQTPHEFDPQKAVMAAVLASFGMTQPIIAASLLLGSVNTLKRHYSDYMRLGMEYARAMARAEAARKATVQSTESGAVRASLGFLEQFDDWNAHKRLPGPGRAPTQINNYVEGDVNFQTLIAAYKRIPEEERPIIRQFLTAVKDERAGAAEASD